MASLVVVLPALPVIATTRAPEARRTARARSCSASSVSATSTITGSAPAGTSTGRWTTTPAAPPAIAAGTKS